MKTLSIRDAIEKGWELTIKNYPFVLGTVLLIACLEVIQREATLLLQHASGLWNLVLAICLLTISLISALVNIGFLKIFIRIFDGERPKFRDLLLYQNLFWKAVGGGILYFLIVLIGGILLIVPGLILAVVYSLTQFLIIDKGMKPIAALKESARITKGARWNLFLFGLVAIMVNIIGAMLLGVGILLTMPVTTFAGIFVYRSLLAQSAVVEAEPVPVDDTIPQA